MLTRIDHIGIACFDLDRTVEFYRSTYGFEVHHTEVNEEQGVREAMLRINGTSDGGASYLQLLEPTRPDSAVGKWLAKNGEGVHHIAFGTEDVDQDSSDIREKGSGSSTTSPAPAPWAPGSPSSTRRTATGSSPNWSRPGRSTDRRIPGPVEWAVPGRGRVGAVMTSLSIVCHHSPGDRSPAGGPVWRVATRGRMGPRSAGLRTPGEPPS